MKNLDIAKAYQELISSIENSENSDEIKQRLEEYLDLMPKADESKIVRSTVKQFEVHYGKVEDSSMMKVWATDGDVAIQVVKEANPGCVVGLVTKQKIQSFYQLSNRIN